MAELRHLVFYEGDVDRVVLTAILAARPEWPLTIFQNRHPKTGKPNWQGKDDMLRVVATAAIGANLDAIVVADLDRSDVDALARWAGAGLAAAGAKTTDAEEHGPLRLVRAMSGPRIALIGVGLPLDALKQRYELESHAMDDYLLRALLDDRVFAALGERVAERRHDVVLIALDEVRRLLNTRGIDVRSAKRVLQLLRGISGVDVSAATLAERALSEHRLDGPLIEDLGKAHELLGLPR